MTSSRTQAAAVISGFVVGGACWLFHLQRAAEITWLASTSVALASNGYLAARALFRGEFRVDVIALLSMAGALLLHQYLAGAVIATMLASGTALEDFASARARRELTALLARAPRVTHLRRGDVVVDVEVSVVVQGDIVLVKVGEVIPVDGLLLSGNAVLDESTLTGEARPATLHAGEAVRSGSLNVGGTLELRATAEAAQSMYAGIVRLVREAETSKSPFVRLADRYALAFLALALVLAAGAWVLSGKPIQALAVLVAATPCPLILAAPAAIIAGISQAARHGILIKGGGTLEKLAQGKVLILDKTGTITTGRPKVVLVETFTPMKAQELVRFAASLEQLSTHPFAPAIVAEAKNRALSLPFPSHVQEEPGSGVRGEVDGHRVALGSIAWLATNVPTLPSVQRVLRRTKAEGSSAVFVAVDDILAGVLLLEDPIRAEAPRALEAFRRCGIQRILMVTGDHPDVAELVGDAVGVDEVFSERTPEEKVAAVRVVKGGGIVIMAGDGVNDAPALALADVGVAMGARGATAASESADVVLTRDQLGSLVLAIRIAQRSRRIALQSAFVGMGLSLLTMGAAAAGWLTPVAGAVAQEIIDLLVVLNAFRALGGGRLIRPEAPNLGALAQSLKNLHRELRPKVDDLSSLATRLDTLPQTEALSELKQAEEFVLRQLLPHEQEEQRLAFPEVAKLLPGEDPTPGLIRTHGEIARLARLFHRMVQQLPTRGPDPEDVRDLRRVLYGLHAILALHFSQEDEAYSLLGDPSAQA